MKATLIILFTVLFGVSGLCNGGPLDHGYLRKTGNIRLLRKADVKLISENLDIKVQGDYTIVKVEYELQNNGPKQDIQYGFPVDAYDPEWTFGDYSGEPGANETLKYFRVESNDVAVKVSQWIVDSVYAAQSTDLHNRRYNYSERIYAINRKWSAVTLQFDSLEVKNLQIEYKVKNLLSDRYPGFSYLPTFSERHFTYHLTPSSNWGDGVVDRFKVTIDISELNKNEIKSEIYGLEELSEKKGVYVFEKLKYDLKKSDRIHIHYDPNNVKRAEMLKERLISNSKIKSISTSNNSLKSNLIDERYSTSWKCKKGDWIDLRLDSITVYGITILNGDFSNLDSFKLSGYVTKMKVIVNDTIIYNTEPWDRTNGKRIIEMAEPTYCNSSLDNKVGCSQNIAEGTAFSFTRKVTSIRIEIIETSNGGIVEISDLFLIGRRE
ncbi:MAG: hypothetical protein ACI8Q1_002499 [Parvicella sp.]|jgi:hypothetical protein